MARFTKALREQIVKDFADRNGGFDPAGFVEEVRETGESHPAYEWFEWDREKAAFEYQVWQAREFVRGLRISFRIENVGRRGPVRVRQVEAPMAFSPMERRRRGGGYDLTDPKNPDHMAELCRQAASSLETWLSRYEAAVVHAGGSVNSLQKQLQTLRDAAMPQERKKAA